MRCADLPGPYLKKEPPRSRHPKRYPKKDPEKTLLNDAKRFDNDAKFDAKIDPEWTKIDAKSDTLTVLGASWSHPGHHRVFYSKTVAGDNSFLGIPWVAFGTLGRPKASATLSGWTFWAAILTQKSEKRHPRRYPKKEPEKAWPKYAKSIQNDTKMDAWITDFFVFVR